MQRIDIPGQPIKNLEKDFPGLRYSKCDGLNDIGESVVYEESYPESDSVRLFIPDNPINKQTIINLTLYFVGDSRQKVKDDFDDYIRKGIHKYWDTARKKEFTFYVKDKITPSEERSYGGIPYIEVTYKLSNINGKTFNHE